MLRVSLLRRCAAAAAVASGSGSRSNQESLTAWLARLSAEARQLPSPPSSLPSSSSSSSHPSYEEVSGALWREIASLSVHASALKETDSVLALVNELLHKGCLPPACSSVCWADLADRLLHFSSTEAFSVLHYPGQPEREVRPTLHGASHRYFVPCPRETLLMAGGVIPLSARLPCEDGEAIAVFLRHFCCCMEGHLRHGDAEADAVAAETTKMNASLIKLLRQGGGTVALEAVAESVAYYLSFLCRLDAVDRCEAAGEGGETSGLLLSFATQLCSDVSVNALGARLTAVGLAFIMEDLRQASAKEVEDAGLSVGMQHLLSSQQFFRASPRTQRLLLHLVRVVSRALYEHYECFSAAETTSSEGVQGFGVYTHDRMHMAPLLMCFNSFTEAACQFNAAHGNALCLPESYRHDVCAELSLATLRALRVEAATPDEFLRSSMDVVDRCSPSMAMEGELLSGKVDLFNYFDLNGESRAALYEDLTTSLRQLVELRPRAIAESSSSSSSIAGVGKADNDEGEANEESDDRFTWSPKRCAMDATSQRIMQRAHEQVIRVLCDSLDTARIDEAYGIVVSHKYHGLIVTKEVIEPLLRVMSRRGDCRVFNLVDLCVLYSNSVVDMSAVTYLFRACAVAGDHYRAQTLLQLLKEVVPGFLIKAPAEVKELLKELKVLPPDPLQLFVSEEEKLVRSAVASGSGFASPPADLQELL